MGAKQHEKDIEKVLTRLAKNCLYIAAKKSKIFLTKVHHIISVDDGIKLEPTKISEVRKWELPQTAIVYSIFSWFVSSI